MISVVCFESTFGVLGDLFGRRRLVVAGTILVAAGSTVVALASSVQVLWIGAALNGTGAGAMFPGSLTSLTAVARSMRQRAHARPARSDHLRRRSHPGAVRRRRGT
ncbi:MFS transporter [Streptomyces sp. NPDC059278]|uniref:MFS transporter n=1 Tax=Streptomyces sp. NPDC059278 TaxID=3346801 RepID=UPI0036B75BCA